MNFDGYFDELNKRTEKYVEDFNDQFESTSDDYQREQDIEDFLDLIEDELLGSIELGVTSAGDDLMSQFDANYLLDDEVKRSLVYQEIAGETWVERVLNLFKENALTASNVKRIVETETHRIINTSKYIVANAYSEINSKTVYKEWNTMRDDRVRETHDYLEGSIVPLNEPFVTIGGDSALYPGGFTDAENNINCRCVVKLKI